MSVEDQQYRLAAMVGKTPVPPVVGGKVDRGRDIANGERHRRPFCRRPRWGHRRTVFVVPSAQPVPRGEHVGARPRRDDRDGR